MNDDKIIAAPRRSGASCISKRKQTALGVVLPVAMILLIVLSFAGLLAARRAASIEEVASNTRVTQVAKHMAEAAARHCESVVIDSVDNEGTNYPNEVARIGNTVIDGPAAKNALWRGMNQWSENGPNLIVAPIPDGYGSPDWIKEVPRPRCIVEPMDAGQFLITARGLSAGATFNANGQLISGSEVWLQSILSPQIPVRSAGGGNE